VVAFCQQEGLDPNRYHFWRREIRRRDEAKEPKPQARTSSVTPSLAPVQLIEDRGSAEVEVMARNGLVVRVPEGATTEHVRRILQLVHQIS